MRYLIFLLLITITIAGYTQKNDATYLELHKTYRLEKDGSCTLRYHHKLKYKSYLAFHRKYGETFVVYNPDYQKINIIKSQTTMADGKVVKAPKNAFNRVLPRFAAGNANYNNLRELVITHTALEKGAVVDLTYEIHSQKTPMNIFAGTEPLRYSSPVNELKISFNIPASQTLQFAGKTGEKTVNENESRKVYTFNYKNLPSFVKNNNAAKNHKHVLMYNAGTSLSALLSRIIDDNAMPANFDVHYSHASKQNIEEVTKIHRKIVKDMKTTHIPLKFQIFPVPGINAIRYNNIGTPLEKAIYLKHKLLNSKFAARVVYEIPKKQFNAKVSNIENIDNVYVMVPTKKGDPLLLPPDHIPGANPIYQKMDKTFVSVDSQGNLLKFEPKQKNEINIDFTLELNDNYYRAKYSGKTKGLMAGWPTANLNSNKIFKNFTKTFEEDFIIKGPAEIELNGSFNASHHQYHNILMARLPYFKTGLNSLINEPLPQKGSFSINTGYTLKEVYTYTIPLNKKIFEIIRLPKNYSEDNQYFSIQTKVEQKKDNVFITYKYHLKKTFIPQEKYNQFREAITHLKNERTQSIVVKIDKKLRE